MKSSKIFDKITPVQALGFLPYKIFGRDTSLYVVGSLPCTNSHEKYGLDREKSVIFHILSCKCTQNTIWRRDVDDLTISLARLFGFYLLLDSISSAADCRRRH